MRSIFDGLKDIALVQQVRIIHNDSIPKDVLLPVYDWARKLLEGDEEDLSLLYQFALQVIDLF